MTGLIYNDIFLRHETGRSHPEQPSRLLAIMRHLEATGLMKQLGRYEAPQADPSLIELVHTTEHVRNIELLSSEGGLFQTDADTVGGPDTYRAALTAAGAAAMAADLVMAGRLSNAFCAVRPPGHHALRENAMGFCFFNNIAICARYLQKKHGLSRIAIVDWDAHHGNGTQEIFYDDPSVFYFSLHQFPHYPGSGRASETGAGDGSGATLNCPMVAGACDIDFVTEFRGSLAPALDKFKPEFILISAGFDGHKDDPLAELSLTEDGFAAMTREVMALARRHCQGRIVSLLEGGYNLDALALSVAAHLRELMATVSETKSQVL